MRNYHLSVARMHVLTPKLSLEKAEMLVSWIENFAVHHDDDWKGSDYLAITIACGGYLRIRLQSGEDFDEARVRFWQVEQSLNAEFAQHRLGCRYQSIARASRAGNELQRYFLKEY